MAAVKWAAIILISIIILVVSSSAIGGLLFERKVTKDVEQMFAESYVKQNEVVTEEDLDGLPEPVQKWLQNSGFIGKEKITAVRLKQKGLIRMSEEQPWLPFEAEQYYTTSVPEFIWHATVKAGPFLLAKGIDRYQGGEGYMLIKLISLIKVVDVRGAEITQGTMVRYLNEIMWFPTAALNDYIHWEPIDSTSARAVMEYNGMSVSAIFYFSEDGDLVNFKAERYMDKSGQFEIWATPIVGHHEFHGNRIPTKGEAVWELESGEFPYIKIEVIDIDYN